MSPHSKPTGAFFILPFAFFIRFIRLARGGGVCDNSAAGASQ
jgi:hypothetical protein